MINLFRNYPPGFWHCSSIQSFSHSRGSFTKSCLRNISHVGEKRQNWSKRQIEFKFLANRTFSSKTTGGFLIISRSYVFVTWRITSLSNIDLARCKGNQMNITRHIKNNGFIRFKFSTRFPSKQQLSGFLSSSYHSKNLVYHVKI